MLLFVYIKIFITKFVLQSSLLLQTVDILNGAVNITAVPCKSLY